MSQVGMLARHECTFNTASNTQEHVQPDLIPENRFDEFWKAYPRKEGKLGAGQIWTRKKLEANADQIIGDVIARVADARQWTDSQFIPLATTYLNQRRWEDEWKRTTTAVVITTLPRETDADAERINAQSLARMGLTP